jgi:pimeloyl-ACP methyl ester carboxylesterase
MMRTLSFEENTLSYAEYGNPHGFPILVQHGLIASIRGANLFERLVGLGARLVSPARPGYGESSPYRMKNIAEWGEVVAHLVDRLELAQFDVLGMSSGAPYSYAIAHRFPDRTRNVYIFSGTPALYDDEILSHWPFPVDKAASIASLEKLAYDLFFANCSAQDLETDDIRDSMMNGCFGIAQDFHLRCQGWGFELSQVTSKVWMRHSRYDAGVPLITAELTARMLPNCRLLIEENDIHFSSQALDDFFRTVVAPCLG